MCRSVKVTNDYLSKQEYNKYLKTLYKQQYNDDIWKQGGTQQEQ